MPVGVRRGAAVAGDVNDIEDEEDDQDDRERGRGPDPGRGVVVGPGANHHRPERAVLAGSGMAVGAALGLLFGLLLSSDLALMVVVGVVAGLLVGVIWDLQRRD